MRIEDLEYEYKTDSLIILKSKEYKLSDPLIIENNGNKTLTIIGTDGVVFDFRGQPYGRDNNGIVLVGANIHIKNIKVCYAGFKGLVCYASNCILENIELYGNCDSGIQMVNGNNTILNCMSHNNFGYKTMLGEKIRFGFSSDGFSDKQHNNEPNYYYNCISYNNSDDGFDFYQRKVEDSKTILKNCISNNNGVKSFNMLNHPRLNTDEEFFSQFVNGKECIDHENNTIYVTLEQFPAFGGGSGFKLGGDKVIHNVFLEKCYANYNCKRGFDQNNNYGEMVVDNCIAKYNGEFDFAFFNEEVNNLYITNCEFSNHVFDYYIPPKINENNSWNYNTIKETSN